MRKSMKRHLSTWLPEALQPHINSASWLCTSRNLRGAGAVFLATIVSQAVTFVSTSIIARQMEPMEFGAYRLALDTASTLCPIILLGLQHTWTQAIAAEPSVGEQASKKAAALVLATICVVSFSVAARVLLAQSWASKTLGRFSILFLYPYVIAIPIFLDLRDGILSAQGRLKLLSLLAVLYSLIFLIYLVISGDTPRVSVLLSVLFFIAVGITMAGFLTTGISLRRLRTSVCDLLHVHRRVGLPIYLAGGIVMLARAGAQVVTGSRLGGIEYGSLSLALMIASGLSLIPAAVCKAKLHDFARAPSISRRTWIGSSAAMVVVGLAVWGLAHVYVSLLHSELGDTVVFVPFLLLNAAIHGQGDMMNRFFLVKGYGNLLGRISLIVGLLELGAGLPMIYYWGIWGVLSSKLVSSVVFVALYGIEYTRFTRDHSGDRAGMVLPVASMEDRA